MAKIKSFGARVYLNGVLVGGVTDISASGTEVAFIDNTTHDTAGGYRTFLGGLKDGGTLEVTGRYNYADDGQAEWKAEEGMRHIFHIILSDNSGLAFYAIVGGFQTSNPLDDAVEFTATAKITGEVFPVYPSVTVTGTLTDGTDPVEFPVMPFIGISNGHLSYGSGDYLIESDAGITNSWTLTDGGDGVWQSTDGGATPVGRIYAAIGISTGTPTVTGS